MAKAIYKEQYAAAGAGAVGPALASATWNLRNLNTASANNLASAPALNTTTNLVTLTAGEYEIRGFAQAYVVNTSHVAIFDFTNNVYLETGTSLFEPTGSVGQWSGPFGEVTTRVSVATGTTLDIGLVHYVTGVTGSAATRVGAGSGSGQPEVYAILEINY